MNTINLLFCCFVALSLFGCGASQGEQLYNKAVQMEQQQGGEMSFSTIQAYREVIKTAPGTKWADKSQQRIDVLQTQRAIRLNNF